MSDDRTFPPKTEVVGSRISLTSYEDTLQTLERRLPDRAAVVTVCNVHSVMSARRNQDLHTAIDGSDIATPDGMPLVWTIRRTVRPSQERVYGPELMKRALVEGVDRGWTHYFYGATEATLAALVSAAETLAPGVKIVGYEAPPFRPLTDQEQEAAIDRIRASGAHLVWIGLGMPKQELWMERAKTGLPGTCLLGVGAAFDFVAGTKRQAPRWMQSSGLEWLFRLVTEPRRLWRRYLWNNPVFLILMARQVLARSR